MPSALYRAPGRCFCCGTPVRNAMCVMWCDGCLDEVHDTGEDLEAFRRRKRREAGLPEDGPLEVTT